jgi:hypothetical protein
MMSTSKSLLAGVTALATMALAAGCTTEVAREEQSSGSQAQTAQTAAVCAPYPKNPACDSKQFLVHAWELANEDPKANAVEPIVAAKDCISGLVAAGALIYGTGGAAPIIITVAGAKRGIETLLACKDFSEYLGRIGLPDNVSCWLEPVLNDKAVQLCECTESCKRGVDFAGGDYLEKTTKFKYGFLDRAESARCYCTDDPKAVSCQSDCKQWASRDANDCTCSDL